MKHYSAFLVIVALCPLVVLALETSGYQSQDSDYLNSMIDLLLRPLAAEIQKSKNGVLDIPDIHKIFRKTGNFGDIGGSFDADHGTLKNLTTIRRTGDVTYTADGATYTVSCPFGLEVVEFYFANYQAAISTMKVNGHIWGSIGNNSINITLQVDIRDGKCFFALTELNVVRLEDVKVDVTGFGPLNHLISELATGQLNKKKNVIANTIEKGLNDAITRALSHVNGTLTVDEIKVWVMEHLMDE